MMCRFFRNVGLASLFVVILGALGLGSISSAQLTAQSSGKASSAPFYLSFEQRILSTFLIAGAGEENSVKLELAQQLLSYAERYMNMPIRLVVVKNFDEFMKEFRGPWPESYSVASDLQLLQETGMRGRVHIIGATKEVQDQIDRFMTSHHLQIQSRMGLTSLAPLAKLLSLNLKGLRLETIKQDILHAFTQAENEIVKRINQISEVGNEIAKLPNFSGSEQGLKIVLSVMFREYFARLGIATKKQIFSDMIGQNWNADKFEQFEVLVRNSGPQFQKLLQVVARESDLSDEILSIFKKLENSVKPVPPFIVQRIIESERKFYDWKSYDLKPLGTGTMAQVHTGVLRDGGEEREVVIRFLKPEIEERVNEDERVLAEVAPIVDNDPRVRQSKTIPLLAPMVADLSKTVREEQIIAKTIENQEAGGVYEHKRSLKNQGSITQVSIEVPGVFNVSKKSVLHVQELVKGQKLDRLAEKYKATIPNLAKVVVQELSRTWLNEVLFGSGFFHSDLHQGNFLVSIDNGNVRVFLLDFGMTGQISSHTRVNLILLAAATEINRSDWLTEALWQVSRKNKNSVSRAKFQSLVDAEIQKIGTAKAKPSSAWISWAIEQGLRFPYEFVSLNRGMTVLNSLLMEATGQPVDVASREVAAANKLKVISMLRETGLVSYWDVIKLALNAIREKISSVIAGKSSTVETGKTSAKIEAKLIPQSEEKKEISSKNLRQVSVGMSCQQLFAR